MQWRKTTIMSILLVTLLVNIIQTMIIANPIPIMFIRNIHWNAFPSLSPISPILPILDISYIQYSKHSIIFLSIHHWLPRRSGPPSLIITRLPTACVQQNPANWGQTLGPDILFKRYLTSKRGERLEKLPSWCLRQMLCLKPWWTWDAIGHSSP